MIIKDINNDEARVSIEIRNTIQGKQKRVTLDFDPADEMNGLSFMEYTPDMARELAKALISAAGEAEAMLDELDFDSFE